MIIKRLLIIFCGILCCLFSVSTASTKDYFVAKNGNDSSSGTKVQPWLTIKKAADTLVQGDTVYIMEGTYHEQVIPQNSGSPGNFITYTSFPGHTVTIDGTDVNLSGWSLIQITGKKYIKISGLHVMNSPGYGIGEEGSGYIIFEKNYVIFLKNLKYLLRS